MEGLRAAIQAYLKGGDNAIQQLSHALKTHINRSKSFNEVIKEIHRTVLSMDAHTKHLQSIMSELNFFDDSSVQDAEKKQRLDAMVAQLAKAARIDSLETNSLDRVIRICSTLDSRMHEINIKVEENQRMLHILSNDKSVGSSGGEKNVEKRFYLLTINGAKWAVEDRCFVACVKVARKRGKKIVDTKQFDLSDFDTSQIVAQEPSNMESFKKSGKGPFSLRGDGRGGDDGKFVQLIACFDTDHALPFGFLVDNLLSESSIPGDERGALVETLSGEYRNIKELQ
ncbi:MAG: hypothetical protein EOM12_13160 [Verrucomicrobiae bacterium]|nr:hypothetical protein [Verrucomicrobiae bacterium]